MFHFKPHLLALPLFLIVGCAAQADQFDPPAIAGELSGTVDGKINWPHGTNTFLMVWCQKITPKTGDAKKFETLYSLPQGLKINVTWDGATPNAEQVEWIKKSKIGDSYRFKVGPNWDKTGVQMTELPQPLAPATDAPATSRPTAPQNAAPGAPRGEVRNTGAAATGARIDESQVSATIVVTPPRAGATGRRGGATNSATTLREGLKLAHANLVAGVPTKVIIRPGTYRESITDLNWNEGQARQTLLVLEGTPGRTIWSGADVLPLSSWKKQGALLTHALPTRFGLYSPFWGPKKLIAHRSEMAFFGSTSLRPEILETYQVNGQTDAFRGGDVIYKYQTRRDPATTLSPGSFGVTQEASNGAKIYVRLPNGAKPRPNSLEFSTRRQLLDLGAKCNLVVRGIDFVRCANEQTGRGDQMPLHLSSQDGNKADNILIDHCRFLWNSGTAFSISGSRFTIRDSAFNYNGFTGIGGGGAQNIVFENNQTNFNCWRAWRGGETGWSFSGFKMHETDQQRVSGHEAIGNCTLGGWWDVYCSNIEVRDSVFLANTSTALQWELSPGPFHGDRLICAGTHLTSAFTSINVGDSSLENSIVYTNYKAEGGNNPGSAVEHMSYPRDDDHAKRHPITRGVYEINNSLIVTGPKTPLLVDSQWWGDDPSFHFQARGQNNVYYSPKGESVFRMHLFEGTMYTGNLGQYADAANERGGQFLDPKLRDPDHYDFRLLPDSPLFEQANSYPSYAMSPAKRAEMQAFFAWLRVGQEGPATPPTNEP